MFGPYPSAVLLMSSLVSYLRELFFTPKTILSALLLDLCPTPYDVFLVYLSFVD
jgi:hypothetical protein